MRVARKGKTGGRFVLIGVLWVLAVAAPEAGATDPPSFHYVPYSVNEESCAARSLDEIKRIDPITVFFYDEATIQNAFFRTYEYTQWQYTGPGNDQFFWNLDYRRCIGTQRSLMDRPVQHYSGRRYHIRMAGMVAPEFAARDPRYGWVTAGTPHHEELFRCYDGVTGHWTHIVFPVSDTSPGGFVEGRREIIAAFRGRSRQMYLFREGNSRALPQCDGSRKRSDGVIAFISIP